MKNPHPDKSFFQIFEKIFERSGYWICHSSCPQVLSVALVDASGYKNFTVSRCKFNASFASDRLNKFGGIDRREPVDGSLR